MKRDQLIFWCGVCVWLTFICVLIALQISENDAISNERQKVAMEMKNFEFMNGSASAVTIGLANYTLDTNGTPLRSIIVTTWDSGSDFLGGILNAMPGNYFHYSALINFGHRQIRGGAKEINALKNLKDLLNCNYTEMKNFIDNGRRNKIFYTNYGRLKHTCNSYPQFCCSSTFLSLFCKLFPFQSMTIENIRLAPLEKLIRNNASLNVRVILLVRDPRGTMQSRKHRDWCPGNPDCDNPKNLCNDLVADYQTAEELLKKYPSRFRTLRYEDLSINPYEMTQEVLQFFGLPFDPLVEEFLDTHTKVNIGGVSSTYRDSKSAPFHWKQDLMIEEIKNIQNKCTKAMELWGYRKVEDFYDYQRTFDPLILPPPFA